jgi:hypothetical protein
MERAKKIIFVASEIREHELRMTDNNHFTTIQLIFFAYLTTILQASNYNYKMTNNGESEGMWEE